mgnify:CR=1 FL=1
MLRAAIEREATWAADRCAALGAVGGDADGQELVWLAIVAMPKVVERMATLGDWDYP